MYLKAGLGGVSLHILGVDDNLDDPVPNFFADVIASQSDQV